MNDAERIASIAAIPADKITPAQRATLTALAQERDVYFEIDYTDESAPYCALWIGRNTLPESQWIKYEMSHSGSWWEWANRDGRMGISSVNPDEILQQQMPSHQITPVEERQG